MPNYLLGKDAKAYIGAAISANAVAADITTIIDNIMDLSVSFTVETVDITTRASGGWENKAPTVKSASAKFQMQWKPGDATGFDAIRTAFLAGTEIFFAALDQAVATTGAQGITSNWVVASFEKGEPLKGAQVVDVELQPSSYTSWFVKAA